MGGALVSCGTACRTARSRNCWPNEASKSITSPSTDGATLHALLADPAQVTRHSTGERWFVDETYVKEFNRICWGVS